MWRMSQLSLLKQCSSTPDLPIYAAAEYNILGRLMHYLPMHASLNPSRVVYLFIGLGIAVESLTAAGAARRASSHVGTSRYSSGGVLISVALVL